MDSYLGLFPSLTRKNIMDYPEYAQEANQYIMTNVFNNMNPNPDITQEIRNKANAVLRAISEAETRLSRFFQSGSDEQTRTDVLEQLKYINQKILQNEYDNSPESRGIINKMILDYSDYLIGDKTNPAIQEQLKKLKPFLTHYKFVIDGGKKRRKSKKRKSRKSKKRRRKSMRK